MGLSDEINDLAMGVEDMPHLRKRREKQPSGKAEFVAAEPTFAVFTDACFAHGIPRTTAYELLEAGAFETFLIGRRRYVTLESMRNLPQKIKEPDVAARLAEIKQREVARRQE